MELLFCGEWTKSKSPMPVLARGILQGSTGDKGKGLNAKSSLLVARGYWTCESSAGCADAAQFSAPFEVLMPV